MGMNPNTNIMEMLKRVEGAEDSGQLGKASNFRKASSSIADEFYPNLLRPNGKLVPKTWTIFSMGEEVVIKDYTFKVAYIGETSILFEPVGPIVIEVDDDK